MAISISSASLELKLNLNASNTDSLTQFLLKWDSDEKLDISTVFDRVLSAQSKTLADAANNDIDMYDLGTWDIGNGAGRDNLGFAHANATIHFLRVINQSASGSGANLVIDTSVANGWTNGMPSGTKTLTPGGIFLLYDPTGIAVTDASNHILRLTASGAEATYDFEFLSKQ